MFSPIGYGFSLGGVGGGGGVEEGEDLWYAHAITPFR